MQYSVGTLVKPTRLQDVRHGSHQVRAIPKTHERKRPDPECVDGNKTINPEKKYELEVGIALGVIVSSLCFTNFRNHNVDISCATPGLLSLSVHFVKLACKSSQLRVDF